MARTLGWIFGGICAATGIINLLFSFQASTKEDMAASLSHLGWDGISRITTTGNFPIAVVFLGLGLVTLASLNATAWKETGGY